MRRKHSTTVYLGADQLDELHDLSFATGVSVSEWIRRGIDLRLAAEGMQPETIVVFVPAEGMGL